MAHFRTSSTMEEKHDFGQPKLADRSPNLCPIVPDHGCVELLWNNGRIVMHGMSNRTNVKAPIPATSPPTSVKAQEKEFRHTTTTLKTRTYRETGSAGNGLQTAVPLEQTRINNQEDEMDPSLDYPIDDFHSEFLTEVPGIDLDSLSHMMPAKKITSCGQVERDIHVLENACTSRAPAGYSGPGRIRNSKLLKFQQQCQTFMSNGRPKDSDLTLMAALDHRPDGDLPITKMRTKEPTSSKWVQPRSSAPLMNFSNFSRVAPMVKSNLQFVDRISSSETACSPSRSNPMGSKLIESANDLSSAPAFHGQMTPVTSKAKMSAPPAQDTVLFQHAEPIFREDAIRNRSINNGNDVKTKIYLRQPSNMSACHGSSFPSHAVAEGKHVMEKPPKPVAVSPSMCSGNGAGASSNGVKNRAKRKIDEGEESAYQSEDLEDSSARVRRPITTGKGASTKRSRGAGVHNLLERRRRGRINEKIRALRKLIPNCTKVDKASTVLEEAIEYLKTLQLRVQIMSVCSGLRMMWMMQPIHPPHAGPFAPVGVNLGMHMGWGFGMGMLQTAAGSTVVPPLPHTHRPLYHVGSIPATAGLHGMPGSTNLQLFGGMGVPAGGQAPAPVSMPMPSHPASSLTPSMRVSVTAIREVNPTPAAAGAVTSEKAMDSAPPNSKDQQWQTTLEPPWETSANGPHAAISRQANKECSDMGIFRWHRQRNQPPHVGWQQSP